VAAVADRVGLPERVIQRFPSSRYTVLTMGRFQSAASAIPHFASPLFRIYSAFSSESPASSEPGRRTWIVHPITPTAAEVV
jgi:hypothetical protein